MYLIAGITGHVGGAAARLLLDDGEKVRTLARDPERAASWSEQGVDVRAGDLAAPDALAGALEGVEGAFLLLPVSPLQEPTHAEARAMISAYAEALRRQPPPKLVVLSSIGAELESGLGIITSARLLEESLAGLGIPTAYVRAASFLENLGYALPAARATGAFDTFLTPTSKEFSMIATRDIGALVARLLREEWTGDRVIELGSPVSPDAIAEALGELLGRPVEARSIPRERWADALAAQGAPPAQAAAFAEMEDSFNAGRIAFGVPGAERVPATTSPAEFYATLGG